MVGQWWASRHGRCCFVLETALTYLSLVRARALGEGTETRWYAANKAVKHEPQCKKDNTAYKGPVLGK